MIEDTSKRPSELHLAGAMIEGTEDYITGMEKAGQAQVVNSTLLPAEILWGTQADFEALGFVFGEPVEGDELFREVTLPKGWRKEASDHDMWSYVVDAEGVRQVAVFYKAAFYDRKAHMSLERPRCD